MNRPLRHALIALAGVLLLSGSGYYAWRHADERPSRNRPPIEPSVQERPDLSERFQRLRDALARHDEAARSAILLEIARFQDAAVAPLAEEADRAAATDGEAPFLAALVEALGRIGTTRAKAALLATVQHAARNARPLQPLLDTLAAFPERIRPIALQATLVALRNAADEDSARACVEALPKTARPCDAQLLAEALPTIPEPRRDGVSRLAADLERQADAEALSRIASVEDARRLLVGDDVDSTRPLPPEAARVLADARASARGRATTESERIAAVRFLEGTAGRPPGRAPSPEAVSVFERAAPSTPQAIDALARIAGRGDKEALAALMRLRSAHPAEAAELVRRLTLYATEATAPLLAEWAADPSLPKEVATAARTCADSLRRPLR